MGILELKGRYIIVFKRKKKIYGHGIDLYWWLLLFSDKLRFQWSSLFIIHTFFSHGSIEIEDSNNTIKCKTNSQRLKLYKKYQLYGEDTEIKLSDPSNID